MLQRRSICQALQSLRLSLSPAVHASLGHEAGGDARACAVHFSQLTSTSPSSYALGCTSRHQEVVLPRLLRRCAHTAPKPAEEGERGASRSASTAEKPRFLRDAAAGVQYKPRFLQERLGGQQPGGRQQPPPPAQHSDQLQHRVPGPRVNGKPNVQRNSMPGTGGWEQQQQRHEGTPGHKQQIAGQPNSGSRGPRRHSRGPNGSKQVPYEQQQYNLQPGGPAGAHLASHTHNKLGNRRQQHQQQQRDGMAVPRHQQQRRQPVEQPPVIIPENVTVAKLATLLGAGNI